MSISERQQKILDILSSKNYATVDELARVLYTSPSSIRRDLTAMQNGGLVKRTHGGVSAPDISLGVASFYDRTKMNTMQKRSIAKKASELLCDGQNIILDSSSTAGFMLPFIARFKDTTVFTNNLATALRSIELGINTHCLGGPSVGGSCALAGIETYCAINNINADILFFSSQSLNKIGVISDSTEQETYARSLMIDACERSVFLCDSSKFDTLSTYTLTNISDVDIAVFDKEYVDLVTSTEIL